MGLIPPAILLTQRIKLLAPTRTPNGAGGFSTTFAEVAEVNGQISEATSARGDMEALVAGGPLDVVFVDITLDLTGTSLNGQMRLQGPDGTEYEVFRIRGQNEYTRVTARAV